MIDVLTAQRRERDRLSTLPYQERTIAWNISELLESRQIKLITGPRRAGKSTLALMMLRNKNFAYLNFDDNRLLQTWDEGTVMGELEQVYPGYKYLLLDEVQNLDHWDLWVSKLYRNGVNLIVTGSNSRMLGSEMATALTGRYIPIELLPFSLSEWIAFNHGNDKEEEQLLSDYLAHGGYPETLSSRGISDSYLGTLFDSTVWKDVAERHKVRKTSDLNDVALYLISNIGNPLSANDIANATGLSSVATVRKFMDYLHEPFLFYYLPRFNNKLKLMTKAPRKTYTVDNGFISAKAFSVSQNLGKLLENMVFDELVRRGYDPGRSLFYYRSRNDKETDFAARKGSQIEMLVQVCYDLSNEKTLKREVRSLVECAEELNCSNLNIITFNEERVIDSGKYKIKAVPALKFFGGKGKKEY